MNNDDLSEYGVAEPAQDDVTLRRNPKQARSRQRVERLLQVAEGLIARYGNTGFSMRELAIQADMPIASAYQYFPNQDAVIRQLVIRYHETFHDWMKERFGRVSSKEDFLNAVMEGIETWIAFLGETPAYRALLSGSQSTEALRKLDAEDSRRNAVVVGHAILRLKPSIGEPRAVAAGLLLCEAANAVTLMASDIEPEAGRKLVAELETMMKLYVLGLLG